MRGSIRMWWNALMPRWPLRQVNLSEQPEREYMVRHTGRYFRVCPFWNRAVFLNRSCGCRGGTPGPLGCRSRKLEMLLMNDSLNKILRRISLVFLKWRRSMARIVDRENHSLPSLFCSDVISLERCKCLRRCILQLSLTAANMWPIDRGGA